MFEKQIIKSTKVNIKNLVVDHGIIYDEDSQVVDLNEIVKETFEEGEMFNFAVKTDFKDTEIIGEGNQDEDDEED